MLCAEEWNTDKIIDSHKKSDFIEPREKRHNPVENHHKLTQLYFNKNTENLSRLSNNYILAYPQKPVEGGVRQGTFQNSLEKDVNVLPKSNIFDNNWSIKTMLEIIWKVGIREKQILEIKKTQKKVN